MKEERDNILKKIEELQELISDSKNDATASELAEYLVLVNKLQARLSAITEQLINKNK